MKRPVEESVKDEKVFKKKSAEAFADAMEKALKGKKSKSKNPILALNRKAERDLDEAIFEAKAKRSLREDKKQLQNTGRIKDIIQDDGVSNIGHERDLKKIARKGVVRLFNAIQAAQNATETAEKSEIVKMARGSEAKKQKINDLSKEGFLELIRSS